MLGNAAFYSTRLSVTLENVALSSLNLKENVFEDHLLMSMRLADMATSLTPVYCIYPF